MRVGRSSACEGFALRASSHQDNDSDDSVVVALFMGRWSDLAATRFSSAAHLLSNLMDPCSYSCQRRQRPSLPACSSNPLMQPFAARPYRVCHRGWLCGDVGG